MPIAKPFNLTAWIESNRDLLKPPVGNKNLYVESGDYIVMIVAGPNARKDYHYNETEELFYQLEGNITLRVLEEGVPRDIPINEGDVLLLPSHVRHSPQRPEPGSIGLVVERRRPKGLMDGFEWYCPACNALLHRVEVHVGNIVDDLPPLFDAFYNSEELRTCSQCPVIHPGR